MSEDTRFKLIQTRYRLVNRPCEKNQHVWTVQEFSDIPKADDKCDCGRERWTLRDKGGSNG